MRFLCSTITLLMISSLAVATTSHPRFYFTNSATDATPGNPTQSVMPGETATFYLRVQLEADEFIPNFNMGVTAPDTTIANLGATTLENPAMTLAGNTTGFRWTGTSPFPGSMSAFAGSGTTGLTGNPLIWQNGPTDDPTYDPATGSFLIGSFSFVANNVPGATKELYMVPFLTGEDDGGSLNEVFLGLGDPAAPAQNGPANLFGTNPDAFLIVINEPPPLIGDYNEDGLVNAADYVFWRNNRGTNNPLPNRDPANMGPIGPADYTAWVDNFGRSESPVAADSASPDSNSTLPHVVVVDQGVTPEGNRSYLFQIESNNPSSAHAVELAFEGAIIDVLASSVPVDKKSVADANDGVNGYEKEEDTWYFDDLFDTENPGNNPFTGTVTDGFADDFAEGELFIALGSDINPGAQFDLIQVIVAPNSIATFSGLIADDRGLHQVGGTFQIPEPASMLVLATGAMLLARRRIA